MGILWNCRKLCPTRQTKGVARGMSTRTDGLEMLEALLMASWMDGVFR